MNHTNLPMPTNGSMPVVVGGQTSDALYLGRETITNPEGGEKVQYGGPVHGVLFGPSGVGKGMRILAPTLLMNEGKSIVVIDPKAQLTAMTAAWRYENGNDVQIIDPFGLLKPIVASRPDEYHKLIDYGLVESAGFNPLATLDPDSQSFPDDAAVIAEALIKIADKDPHWTESAQGLVTGLIMWERMRNGAAANLENVRAMLTEADEWEPYEDNGRMRERQVKGLRVIAERMVKEGNFETASLAGRFADAHTTDEMQSIRSTADTQTRWMLSRPMRADLKKNGVDFRKLKTGDKPLTVYVIIPAEYLETHSIWLRLVVSEALRANMTIGGRRVLLILDEFAALGHLSIVQRLFGVIRDYRIQMWLIFQDLPQLKSLYERWETLLGMAGVVQSFRTGDLTTAEWISKRAGNKTVVAASYNQGTSQSSGGSGSNAGLGFNQVQVPTIRPEDMMGLSTDYTIAFIGGMQRPNLLYVPHLVQMRRILARALSNPYYYEPKAGG